MDVWFHGLGLTDEESLAAKTALGQKASFSRYVTPRQTRPLLKGVYKGLCNRLFAITDFSRPIDYWFQAHWTRDIQELSNRVAFDVVVVVYAFTTKALLSFDSSTLRLVDTQDVFFDRKKKITKVGIAADWRQINARSERKGLLRGDVILAIQEEEATVLSDLLGKAKPVVTVGHSVEIKNLWNPNAGYTIGYLGTSNALNIVSMEWFLSSIWPDIRKQIPHATLLIGGAVSEHLSPREGVSLLGQVADVEAFYKRCLLMVNPTRTGSGLKIKTVEALGFGLPVVSTAAGAAGLVNSPEIDYLKCANGAADFAHAVVELLPDIPRLSHMSRKAIAFAEEWNSANTRNLASILPV
jgi:glycosyltransferase involved in cell wall biosynthesis